MRLICYRGVTVKRKRKNRIYIASVLTVLTAYVLALALIGCIFVALCELVFAGKYNRDDFEAFVCVVQPGETAWDYAKKYCPSGVDYRIYLEWCAKENGLSDMGCIQSGRHYVFLKLIEK